MSCNNLTQMLLTILRAFQCCESVSSDYLHSSDKFADGAVARGKGTSDYPL